MKNVGTLLVNVIEGYTYQHVKCHIISIKLSILVRVHLKVKTLSWELPSSVVTSVLLFTVMEILLIE